MQFEMLMSIKNIKKLSILQAQRRIENAIFLHTNAKMPTIYTYEQNNFHAQMS